MFKNGLKVLVIGDIILDTYRIGEVSRISPEAPVPILLNPKTEHRLGGAAGVAAMCAALGADVTLIGVIGEDKSGLTIRTLVGPARVKLAAVIDPSRPTTTKERICGVASGRHRQQLGRIDYECTKALGPKIERHLANAIRSLSEKPDVVLISDYDKGIRCVDVMRELASCKDRVIVDPPCNMLSHKFYKNVSCVVPNRLEASLHSPSEFRHKLGCEAVIVKLDQDGCHLCYSDHTARAIYEHRIPTNARSVYDVTGAGDQFLATLGCARGSGMGWYDSTKLANTAAGLQVERHGCVPVTLDELIAA